MTTPDKAFLLNVALPLAIAAYEASPTLPPGFRVTATISSPSYPNFGFVATFGATTYLVLRGTQKPLEWLQDFDATMVDVGGFGVHAGFQRVFESLLPSIRAAIGQTPPDTLCVIGHSLGAAVATLAAASFRAASCVVFASPRVGDAKWQAHCIASTEVLRITNTKDIVTHVPERPLFIHVGRTDVFNGWKAGLNLDPHFQHSLESSYTPGVKGMSDYPSPVVLS